jgi:hypothetical protein
VSLRNSFVEPYVAVTVIAEAVQRPATGLVQSFDVHLEWNALWDREVDEAIAEIGSSVTMV